MIEIVYDRAGLGITVRGHAHYADAGYDPICAAASMLCYTAAANVQQLCKRDPQSYGAAEIRLDSGDAEIVCHAVGGRAELCAVLDTVCVGFGLLAKSFPQNVAYCVLGKEKNSDCGNRNAVGECGMLVAEPHEEESLPKAAE